MGTPTQGGQVLTESQRECLRVREYLQQHRDDLGQVAAEEYPDVPKVDGTSLLTRLDWLATEPPPRLDRPEVCPGLGIYRVT